VPDEANANSLPARRSLAAGRSRLLGRQEACAGRKVKGNRARARKNALA